MGYVPDRLLPTLYANAEMFVMPSVYEGFGMPVLEARACGARVVVSDTPELREAGGPHAVAVEPTKAGIREGIRRALRSPRIREVSLAREHSWSQAAAQLLAVFQSALDARNGRHAKA
jgi:glycosyltransferase involved in cell wall biosynthesis